MSVRKKISWQIIKDALPPLILLLLFFGAYVFYRLKVSSHLSAAAQEEIAKHIRTFFIISAGLIIHRIAGVALSWYKENIAAKTAIRLDDELVPLLRRSLKIIIWIVALLVILPVYGVNISALVAALGVSSLAIALAAQDTIANIISGFMIMIDRPFRLGDRIKLPSGEIVEVLEIGVRRSSFLSEDKAIVIVPNLDLSKSKIINYTYGEERSEGREKKEEER
jgi:MscS family membrane protein